MAIYSQKSPLGRNTKLPDMLVLLLHFPPVAHMDTRTIISDTTVVMAIITVICAAVATVTPSTWSVHAGHIG